jgi:hypothetical protein
MDYFHIEIVFFTLFCQFLMGKFDLGGEIFVLERGKKLPILPGDDAVFWRLLHKEKKTCTSGYTEYRNTLFYRKIPK